MDIMQKKRGFGVRGQRRREEGARGGALGFNPPVYE